MTFITCHHLRIPGILQRIALCYAISALLYLAMSSPAGEDPTLATDAQSRSTRTAGELATVIAVILIGYWVLLRYFAVPGFGPARYDSLGYLGAYIDRAVFTTRHLWAWGLTPGYGVTYDPEGLLSTLPVIANTLLGVLAGVWLRMPRPARSKGADLLYFGALLFLVAWPLSSLMPINKRIWTSTLSLLSRRRQPAGPGRSLLATRSPRRAAPQFRSTRLPIDISLHPGSRTSERAVALNAGLLYPLYRKRIFLRI